jgi:hypothetical protein
MSDDAVARIVACRPRDVNPNWPDAMKRAFLQLAPLEEGKIDSNCEMCQLPIEIGPRQRKHLVDHPEDIILCMFCAVRELHGAGGTLDDVFHLGGR